MDTKLSMTDVENRLREAYSAAKYTGGPLRENIKDLKTELNSRTPAGRRRYPLFMAHYASGFESALFKNMMEKELECVRWNTETGETFTSDNSGRSALPRIPSDKVVEVATSDEWQSGMRFIETGKTFK